MGKLANYESKTPEFMKLGTGEHVVRLVSYKILDSNHNYDGTLKDNLPQFVNATEQLAITVVSIIPGKGGMTHRLNMDGYVKYSELSDEEKESGNFIPVGVWACAKDPETGKLVRLTDEARTKTCEGFLDQLFASLGIQPGSRLNALDNAIANKTAFVVNVARSEWEGKEQMRITSFRKVSGPKAQVQIEIPADMEA